MNKVLKALADPNRRQILDLLKTKDMHVNELLKYSGESFPSFGDFEISRLSNC